MDFKNQVVKLLKPFVKEVELEIPKDDKFGDYSFPCFNLAKKFRKNPHLIAQDLRDKVKLNKYVVSVEAVGPYLNFFINKKMFHKEVISAILKQKGKYGVGKSKEKIVIEFPSPNTNKPLHLGHIRNILIGGSVGNILEFSGQKVFRVNLNQDRGIHICKSMLAYEKYGRKRKPNKKSDHFVGDFYVLFSQKLKQNQYLEQETQEMLRKWEQGDKKTHLLWRKLNGWALKGFNETYKKFDLKFNKIYNESEHYKEGKDIILSGLKKGVFYKKNDGAIAVNLKKYGLDEKVLLRPDGTSIYITQDVNLARLKYKDFKMDKSIFVVGSEQNYHFKVLFKVLELLGVPYAKGNHHLSYGMVYLPEGKMKSREGNVVDADDIVEQMIIMARKEVKRRYKNLSKKEVDRRSKAIGMGALKFFILKTDSAKDIKFNPKESISFEGETGPYCQYVYARISSILRKYKKRSKPKDLSFNQEDVDLIKFLFQFPQMARSASQSYKPHIISRYVLELSRKFNNYYEKVPILRSEGDILYSRIMLISAVRQVIKNGLNLLGIGVLEEM